MFDPISLSCNVVGICCISFNTFAKVPDILNLIKTLSKDRAAQYEMCLAITTAAYKPRCSVGTTILNEILEKVIYVM